MAYFYTTRTKEQQTLRASIPVKLLPEDLRDLDPKSIGEKLRAIAMQKSPQDLNTQMLLSQSDRFMCFVAGERLYIDFGAIPETSNWAMNNPHSDPTKMTAPQMVRELLAKHLLPEGSPYAKTIYVTYGIHNPDGP